MRNCYNCYYRCKEEGMLEMVDMCLEDVFCSYTPKIVSDIEANEGCSLWESEIEIEEENENDMEEL